MTLFDPKPFKVDISSDELELLRKKLELARFPVSDSESTWGEDNGITVKFMQETVEHWLNKYDWEAEQRKINELPQYKVKIELKNWGSFDVHYVHKRSEQDNAIPLLFLHGWPGNFTEVTRILEPLLASGFDVVAASLPGYGFTSYAKKEGFKNWHSAELMHRLMTGLGYSQYTLSAGDWGAMIATSMARLHPNCVLALHLTNVLIPPPPEEYLPTTPFEHSSLSRRTWFSTSQSAYGIVQRSKPRTLGFALHDSPLGLLAWMADKLLLWSDDYPWSKDELITWTLLHYFPGPTTAFQMYRENLPVFEAGERPEGTEKYVAVPTGVSAFEREVYSMPRGWVERDFNVVQWREWGVGGHFPAYERPEEVVGDIVGLVKGSVGLGRGVEGRGGE